MYRGYFLRQAFEIGLNCYEKSSLRRLSSSSTEGKNCFPVTRMARFAVGGQFRGLEEIRTILPSPPPPALTEPRSPFLRITQFCGSSSSLVRRVDFLFITSLRFEVPRDVRDLHQTGASFWLIAPPSCSSLKYLSFL